ncbi:hypothetical protein [Phnomibacter sp. MR]|uniref:hypothetical protein n=1 Tax=Phnomibacter sp. MR TaxID=3042318 RepID=UPI003A80D4E1
MDTPIAIIFYNRPAYLQSLLNVLAIVRPTRLFAICDGPKDAAAAVQVNACRQLIDQISWPCTVTKNYAATNMGLRGRFDSGLDWFFDLNEAGIVLEDDVIPDPSFFTYTSTLLHRYMHDDQVMQIGGLNFQDGIRRTKQAGYYFSAYAHSWAFATWRRAWQLHDKSMADWPTHGLHILHRQFGKDKQAIQYWQYILNRHHQSPNDTWDYPWQYSIWRHQGICCIPEVNLIKNIGFGPDAIHTKDPNGPGMNKNTFTLENCTAPTEKLINRVADLYTLQHIYGVDTNFWRNSKLRQYWLGFKHKIFSKTAQHQAM